MPNKGPILGATKSRRSVAEDASQQLKLQIEQQTTPSYALTRDTGVVGGRVLVGTGTLRTERGQARPSLNHKGRRAGSASLGEPSEVTRSQIRD